MAYATQAQLEVAAGGSTELVKLADFDRDGVADAAVIAQAQAEVDAIIDSYALAGGYDTPIASPSSALQAIAAAEYVYWIRSKRNMVGPDHVREHEERLGWMKAMSKRQVVPANPAPARAPEMSKSSWVERDTDDVSRESLEGFS